MISFLGHLARACKSKSIFRHQPVQRTRNNSRLRNIERARAGTLYAPPGENNIEITGLHVVIAVGVVAVGSRRRAASRPTARNRNRQLGQSMPNVRHHSSWHVRDFSVPTYTRILVLSLLSPFLLHLYFFFFFRGRKIAACQTQDIATLPRVPNATIYVSPKRFSAAPTNVRRWLRDLCETKTYDSADRRRFTCFANRIQRDRRYRKDRLRIDLCETQSNQFTPLELR